MKNIISFFLCLFALTLCSENYQKEKDVLLLDENNLGFAMHEFKYLLVLFYSPDDPNCQEIIPIFEKTASILKNEKYVSGKIDYDKSPEIVRLYKIETFPSIVLIKKTVPINYEGEQNPEQIINWLKEKTKKEYTKIATKAELEDFLKKHDIAFIYFGKDDKVLNEINLAERRMDDMPMGIVNSEELINFSIFKTTLPFSVNEKQAKSCLLLMLICICAYVQPLTSSYALQKASRSALFYELPG